MNHPMLSIPARLVAVLCLAACGAARAASPLVTDDAGTLEPGRCELEVLGALARSAGSPTLHGSAARIGCGVVETLELSLGRTDSLSADEHRRDWTPGGKWRLRGDEDSGLALGFGANVLELADRSLRIDALALNLIGTHKLGPSLDLHLNLGWMRHPAEGGSGTTWNAAIEWVPQEAHALCAEIFGDDHGAASVGLGWRWTIGSRVTASLGLARGLGSDHGSLRLAGVKFAF